MATEVMASKIPHGMREVTKDQFWSAVMSTTKNVHPSPEHNETYWNVVGTREVWGWTSYGFGNGRDGSEVYALRASA